MSTTRTVRSNAWTCFFWGLVVCAILLTIVWLIG